MTDKNKSNQEYYPPPPPGPPPGHNGLAMHPTTQSSSTDSHSELYDNPTPIQTQQSDYQPQQTAYQPQQATYQPQQAAYQQQQQQQPPYQTQETPHQAQQTPHQPPPPDSDGAPQKVGWGQRLSLWGGKAATPFNVLANKLGSEAFLPGTMDKECEKAARILRSFCKDGIYTDTQAPETVEAPITDANGKPTTATAKPKKNRTLLSIPSKVINRAVGLAIFTTARAGFHVSGATGSGVLVARLPDGSWSPPSGIQVHSLGAGFMIGVDIYDCVVVINTKEALEAFTKTRVSLGSDLAVVAGPWGAGGAVDFAAPPSQKGKGKEGAAAESTTKDAEGRVVTPPPAATHEKHPDEAYRVPTVNEPASGRSSGETPDGQKRPETGKERKPSAVRQALKQPTYSYVKSRGFYAGVQVDGTIVTERKDANAAFYGEAVSVQRILKGEVTPIPGKENWLKHVKPLFDTIKGAEGWRGQQSDQWANQQGPVPAGADTYGRGNAGPGYAAGFDPVFSAPPGADEQPPPTKPPRSAAGVAGVTEGVRNVNLDGASSSAAGPSAGEEPVPHAEDKTAAARSKAAEAAAEAEAARAREERERRELATTQLAPPYTETAGPGESSRGDAAGELPPAYVDDGAAGPGVGDSKHPGGPSS